MSKDLEKLNKQKQNIEEKIKKVSSIANAREYSFNEIYDHDVMPFLATRACIYGAGETFVREDIKMPHWQKIVCMIIYGAHLITGVLYFAKIFVGGAYF